MSERRIPFTREDEERIASVGVWGNLVGIVSIVSAALSAIVSIMTQGAFGFVAAAIGVTITVIPAIWLMQAAAAFRKVALSDEADEHYLLHGFSRLRNYFMMIGIVIIVVICIVVLLFLAALTCGPILRRGF